MNIGLIGAGAIANFLLQELNEREQKGLSIQSMYVRDQQKYAVLAERFGVTLYTDLAAFLSSNIDVVVEAATIEAVQELVPAVLKRKPVVLISIGALADEQLLQELNTLSLEHHHAI